MRKIEYKWVALLVTTIGSMMVAIDSTIVILGLPICSRICTRTSSA
jgi:hypothetical protein